MTQPANRGVFHTGEHLEREVFHTGERCVHYGGTHCSTRGNAPFHTGEHNHVLHGFFKESMCGYRRRPLRASALPCGEAAGCGIGRARA